MAQQCTWLGFNIDIQSGKVSIPQEKVVALQDQLSQALKGAGIPSRLLASLTGKIISVSSPGSSSWADDKEHC